MKRLSFKSMTLVKLNRVTTGALISAGLVIGGTVQAQASANSKFDPVALAHFASSVEGGLDEALGLLNGAGEHNWGSQDLSHQLAGPAQSAAFGNSSHGLNNSILENLLKNGFKASASGKITHTSSGFSSGGLQSPSYPAAPQKVIKTFGHTHGTGVTELRYPPGALEAYQKRYALYLEELRQYNQQVAANAQAQRQAYLLAQQQAAARAAAFASANAQAQAVAQAQAQARAQANAQATAGTANLQLQQQYQALLLQQQNAAQLAAQQRNQILAALAARQQVTPTQTVVTQPAAAAQPVSLGSQLVPTYRYVQPPVKSTFRWVPNTAAQ